MRILLTGATGFVGSHVLSGLLEDGHSVCVVKRSYSDIRRIKNIMKKCDVYDLDITDIEQIYREQKIDCVVHCATYYGRSDMECTENIRSNLLFPLELLNVGKNYGIRFFLNTESFFENQIMFEKDLEKEIYLYGYVLSKIQFRQWGHLFSNRYGIKFINMKLEHVYGAMDNEDKFVSYVERECRKNVMSLALSLGTQERDFVHISDVVDAYRIVISHMEKHWENGYVMYEVGTGQSRSLREFVELIHKAVHSNTRLDWGVIPTKAGEIMQSKADNTGLLKLGWMPKVVTDSEIEQKFGGGDKFHFPLSRKVVCLNGQF